MNTTIGNSTGAPSTITTPAASESGNQFTHANVVGMLLTLQLCQLTQPYGSLLFRGVSGFFWRCNPISSFVEACIIYSQLGAEVLRFWKEGRSATLDRLRCVSSGLLLLRGAIGKDDVRELMQKLTKGGFLDREEGGFLDREETVGTAMSNADLDGHEGVILDEIQSDAHPVVLRQSSLEANRPTGRGNSLPAYDPASEQSQILHEAFGPNVLAHKELRIDLFTAFTELTIFIKLAAVRGNGWFTAAAFFLVCGWASVQTLLVLFHLREMSEMEMAAAARIARTVNTKLEERAGRWNALFIVLHLPFFGYAAYLASFQPWHSGFLGLLRSWYRVLGLLISSLAPWFSYFVIWITYLGCNCLALQSSVSRHRYDGPSCRETLLWLLTVTVLGAWLAASSTSYYQQNCGELGPFSFKSCDGDFTSFFQPQNPLYYIVDKGFDVMYKGLTVLLPTFLILIVFFRAVMPNADSDTSASSSSARTRSSVGNFLFVLVVLVVYLIYYDPSKTSKPTWTEYLG